MTTETVESRHRENGENAEHATQNGSSLLVNLLHTHATFSWSFCYAMHHTVPVPLSQMPSLCPLFLAMLYAMQNLARTVFVVDFDYVRGDFVKHNRLNKPIAWKNKPWIIQKAQRVCKPDAL